MSNNTVEKTHQVYYSPLYLYVAVILLLVTIGTLRYQLKQKKIRMEVIRIEENKKRIAQEREHLELNEDLSI